MKKDLYEILEVSKNVSIEVLEAAYKRLAKKYHPDMHNRIDRDWAENKMTEINYAYQTLKDPVRRRNYDFFLLFTSIPGKYLKSIRRPVVLIHLMVLLVTIIIGIGFNSRDNHSSKEIGTATTKSSLKNNSADEDTVVINIPGDKNVFTLGSPKDVVKKVMGMPNSMYISSWRYGASLVYFDSDGKVEGWAIVDKPLKVWIGDKQKNAAEISVGSTKRDVIKALGTPTSMFQYSWAFGSSMIYFDNEEKVKSWSIIDQPLPVKG